MDLLYDLNEVLLQCNVQQDSNLIVHSSLSQLCKQGVEAHNLIDILLNKVKRGGLFMPTMSWRTVTPSNACWDELLTPSHTGILTEIFRKNYAECRSIHPTHSVAGAGPFSKDILSRHHLDHTPVSDNSPYGLMREYDSYVLLLGVGLEVCTAIHLCEEKVADHIYLEPIDKTESYICNDRYNKEHVVYLRRHLKLNRNFQKYFTVFEANKSIFHGKFGGCSWAVINLKELINTVTLSLNKDNYANLNI